MFMIYLSATGLPNVKSTGESLLELLGVIVIFIVVLVACYLTTKFIAGKQLKQKSSGNIQLIETYSIAQNRCLQLLRIGKKYVVISVTKDNVSLLAELSEDELVLVENGNAQSQVSFKDVLSRMLKKDDASLNGAPGTSENNNEIK